MKILLVNKFLYPKGGDAISVLATGRLLSERGHDVAYWGMDHPENLEYPHKKYFIPFIDFNRSSGKRQQIKTALNILYSFDARSKMEALLNEIKPDMVHLNNFAHQISPSILDVIKKRNIPAVMTMHDYKLTCPSYSMLVDGKPCERCSDGRYYHCLLNRCTKNSFFKSLVNTAEMYLHHRILGICGKIQVFISPSRFLMDKVKEMGFKGDVVHLPNFVRVENIEPSYEWQERSIVYVGRLSFEKGLKTLIEAVSGLDIKLKIIGDGPLMAPLSALVREKSIKNIEFLGYKKGVELESEIKGAMFVVLPSECYENNPRSLIEAFAMGKSAVGARIGGIPELVRDWETGLTFEAGNVTDLREKINLLLGRSGSIPDMGRQARKFVETELNAELHYDRLMEIYSVSAGKARCS